MKQKFGLAARIAKRLLGFGVGEWRNTLCPVCGWWMMARNIELYEKDKLVRVWYCINPAHEYTRSWPRRKRKR
jgi:hypothetical protein